MLKKSLCKPLFYSAIAILLAGCAESHTSISPATTAPAPPPAVYNPEQHPHPLTPSQFHDIQSRATHAHAAPIWFVYVAENDGAHYRVAVHFLPTSHNDRVSHGEYALFQSASREQLDFMQQAGISTIAIENYTYVADAPAAAPLPTPSLSNLPFRTPEYIPDADLPKILDAASAVFTAHPAIPLMPVHRVVADPNGNVRVFFGWMTAPLSGHGTQVELQRKGADFTIISTSDWVS